MRLARSIIHKEDVVRARSFGGYVSWFISSCEALDLHDDSRTAVLYNCRPILLLRQGNMMKRGRGEWQTR